MRVGGRGGGVRGRRERGRSEGVRVGGRGGGGRVGRRERVRMGGKGGDGRERGRKRSERVYVCELDLGG